MNATSQAFEEKAQFFVNQYGNFTVKGPQGEDLNGELTLGENLADNGGIKMAFRIWQSRHKSDPKGNKYVLPLPFFFLVTRIACRGTRRNSERCGLIDLTAIFFFDFSPLR